MTELTPETITDEQVNNFFENEGKIAEIQPQVDETPEKPDTKPEEKQPEVAKEEEKEEKKVNYGALHEERMRRKEAAERAKKAEERAAELERQLQQYAQRNQEPEYNDDPIEAMRREQDQIKQVLLAQANQAIKQTEEEKYWSRVAESEKAFKQDVPDFDDAIKYLSTSRTEELMDLGFSQQEAAKVLSDEIRWIADKAYADEVNPAERFYNLAKRRGWNAKPAEHKAEEATAQKKLENIERGMKSNKQLPPASKSVNQDLTADALADMNIDALSNLRGDTEFDKAWKKIFG